MLNLKEIKKDYVTSSETVHALKGVSIAFRKQEFVSILGPSGCGKTTLLNIIGGLDHYTDGDLVINGRSTRLFADRDWDVYRNHRVGFIFQSYNLIPHQNVLTNVELALTIAGIPKEERVERAKRALDRVGLSDQYYKRPNQLSGGQCQRVAIARALVNDPEILLADEPTGALDTVTSVQIMDLVQEIAKERLVIMVTHNPELAEQYSTRIVRLIDGCVTEDTNPFSPEDEEAECVAMLAAEEAAEMEAIKSSPDPRSYEKANKKKREKAKMSFFTAFMLSLKNLFTKKGRTMLTSFAGSIGIIGIALILAVSQGMTAYINDVQESTLSSYPLTLESTSVDASALISSILGANKNPSHDNDAVYKDPLIGELVEALSKVEANENDLTAFKAHLESELAKEDSPLREAITGIQYTYDIELPIYTKNQDGNIIKSDTNMLMQDMLAEFMMGLATNGSALGDLSQSTGMNGISSGMVSSMLGINMWQELLPGLADADGSYAPVNPILYDQYEVIHGKWPSEKNELVLVLNENNELDDLTLYALGLLTEEDIDAIIDASVNGQPMPETSASRWTYEQICALTFKTIFPYEFYQENNDGTYSDVSENAVMLKALYEDAMELKVVGIIKPSENADNAMLSGSIAYTHALTQHVISEAITSDVVVAQMANPDYDILTGLPFKSAAGKLTNAEKESEFRKYVAALTDEEKANVYLEILCLKAEADPTKGLSAQTDMMLNMFKEENKASLIDMIMKNLQSNVNADTVRGYFEALTLDELKTLLRPYIEEQVKIRIRSGVESQISSLDTPTKVALLATEFDGAAGSEGASEETFALWYDSITVFSDSTYEDVLVKIGKVDLDSPKTINLYASSFENKDVITAAIEDYNDGVAEDKKIAYTDIMGILMSSITTIINAITYVLIAFVAISLVVSSIMIGVITLISVQERTKEIGILRAIGASKRDVSSMFNAETIIIGLASGLLGVIVTYLLCIPINIILHTLTGLSNLSAVLPLGAAALLVLISVCLTLFSGLIPASSAAKKDPVVALRSE